VRAASRTCSGRCSMASRPEDPVRARSKAPARKRAPAPTWQAWRIADGRFDPFSPVGASLVGGRWNSPGLVVINASRSYAGAMLECLAHAGIGRVPRTHVAFEIAIAGVTVERHDETGLPVVGTMRTCVWPEPLAMPGFASCAPRYWLCPRSWHAGKATSSSTRGIPMSEGPLPANRSLCCGTRGCSG
jgi:RES domain-containing protein